MLLRQRDAVENVRWGIPGICVSLEMFRDIDRCLNSGVQENHDNGIIEIKPKQGIYNNGFAMVAF
jgi:hypothetical protein